MKTIEERAKYLEQKVIEYNPTTSSEHLYTLVYNALDEQMKNDIEKACEAIYRFMSYDGHLDTLDKNREEWIEMFRKAMEEN